MGRRWLFGLVAALAIYLGLTTAFGIQEVSATLGKLPLHWWILAPAICLGGHLLLLGRWCYYLSQLGFPLRLKPAAKIYAEGLALIAAPGRSGEAVRGVWLQRRHGFPVTVGVGITLAERLADLASALLVLSLGLKQHAWTAMLIFLAFIGICCWVVTHPRVIRRLEHWLERLPRHQRWNQLIRLLREGLLAMNRVRQLMKPKPLIVGTLLASICWMLEAGLLLALYQSLGTDLSLHQTAVIRTATGLGGVISLLPAGLGTSEATSIGLAMLYGADRSQALAVTMLLRLSTLVIPCLVGVLAMISGREETTEKA